MKKHNTLLRILLAAPILLLALSGCGIKPGHLDAPTAEKTDNFPSVYPNTTE